MTITYVYGPPFGGKTTYVREHARSDDLVFDRTTLAATLHPFSNPPKITQAVHRTWPFLVYQVAPLMAKRGVSTWIIETGPEAHRRKRWQKVIDDVIFINPGKEECHRRCEATGQQWKAEWIDTWFARYTPDISDDEHFEQKRRTKMIEKRLVVDPTTVPNTPSRQW